MIKLQDKGFLHIQMEHAMKEAGKMIYKMDLELKHSNFNSFYTI